MTHEIQRMYIKVTGQVSEKQELIFEPGKWECGKVTDGVCLGFAKEGMWIIEFKDLVRMVDAAKKARKK